MTDYRWVQVDEVQDMTPLQLAIVGAGTIRHRRTAIYFGDEQQAIFKFLGAGGRALEVLKQQCGGNILRLTQLSLAGLSRRDVQHPLTIDWLGLDREYLPDAVDTTSDHGSEAYTGRPRRNWFYRRKYLPTNWQIA